MVCIALLEERIDFSCGRLLCKAMVATICSKATEQLITRQLAIAVNIELSKSLPLLEWTGLCCDAGWVERRGLKVGIPRCPARRSAK